jgi:hypothetical protein
MEQGQGRGGVFVLVDGDVDVESVSVDWSMGWVVAVMMSQAIRG